MPQERRPIYSSEYYENRADSVREGSHAKRLKKLYLALSSGNILPNTPYTLQQVADILHIKRELIISMAGEIPGFVRREGRRPIIITDLDSVMSYLNSQGAYTPAKKSKLGSEINDKKPESSPPKEIIEIEQKLINKGVLGDSKKSTE